MRLSIWRWVLATSLIFGAGVRAQTDGAEDPRKYVQKAKVHYDLGEFEKAAESYIEAYRLKSVPGVLFNIAQCYRQAGLYEKARQFYRSFMRESPDAKSRGLAESALKEVEDLLAQEKRTKDAEPHGLQPPPADRPATTPPTAALHPPPAAPQPPAAAPALPPLVVVANPSTAGEPEARPEPKLETMPAAQPPVRAPSAATRPGPRPPPPAEEEVSSPMYTKWWLWTAVGVVAVGAGVMAATTGGNSAPPSALGTNKVF